MTKSKNYNRNKKENKDNNKNHNWTVNGRGGLSGKRMTYNVLILGETGVGKSTFINSLANYLCYDTFEIARQCEPMVLIKSDISVKSKNSGKFEVVKVDATVKRGKDYAQDEDTTAGNSATQITQTYLLPIPNSQVTLRLIDTPGVGDKRGIEQDKKNFQTVLDSIGQLDEIHAILIVMKPTHSRETLTFRFCIDELLTNLHKSAADNILFCFTNSGGSQRFTPGESIGPLRQHLEKIERENETSIELNQDRIFCYDNTPFRFICEEQDEKKRSTFKKAVNYAKSLAFGTNVDIGTAEMAANCWDHSQSEAKRMVQIITDIPPHETGSTACLNEVRQTIIMLARPLAEISKNQAENMKLIEDKRIEIKRRQEQGEELKEQLYLDQAMLNPIELDYPRTVCTSAKCVERKKFRPTDAMEQIVYKTACHDHCYLSGVQVENCPNEELKNCSAMTTREGQRMCYVCGCPWSTHMHIRYKLETTFERVENTSVKDNLDSTVKEIDAVKIFLKELTKTERKLQDEQAELRTACAELAMFLNKNSMVAYNDSYGQFLAHQIRQEEDLKRLTGKSDILERLKINKREYDQEVLLIKQNVGGGRKVPSVQEVQKIIQKLRNMEKIGAMIVRFENVTRSALRTETTRADLVVPVNETREQARRAQERLERERQLEEQTELAEARQQQARDLEEEMRQREEQERRHNETALETEIRQEAVEQSKEIQALHSQIEQMRLDKERRSKEKEDRRREKEEEKRQKEKDKEEKRRRDEENRRRQEDEDRRRREEEERNRKDEQMQAMMRQMQEMMLQMQAGQFQQPRGGRYDDYQRHPMDRRDPRQDGYYPRDRYGPDDRDYPRNNYDEHRRNAYNDRRDYEDYDDRRDQRLPREVQNRHRGPDFDDDRKSVRSAVPPRPDENAPPRNPGSAGNFGSQMNQSYREDSYRNGNQDRRVEDSYRNGYQDRRGEDSYGYDADFRRQNPQDDSFDNRRYREERDRYGRPIADSNDNVRQWAEQNRSITQSGHHDLFVNGQRGVNRNGELVNPSPYPASTFADDFSLIDGGEGNLETPLDMGPPPGFQDGSVKNGGDAMNASLRPVAREYSGESSSKSLISFDDVTSLPTTAPN